MKRFFARNRKYTLIFIDAGFVLVSYLAAILLFQTGQMSDSMFRAFEFTVLLSALLCVLLFFLCNIYRNILLYSSVREYTVICLAVILKMTVMINLKLYTDLNLLPIRYIILSSLILMFLTIGFRVFIRLSNSYLTEYANGKQTERKEAPRQKRILIIGAGSAANIVTKELQMKNRYHYDIVGLIDDDISKHNGLLNHIKIIGGRDCIKDVCKERNVEEILIAIPSIAAEDKKEIVNICHETGCSVKILPPIGELGAYRSLNATFRSLNIEDLLERDSIKLDSSQISAYIKGKVILVTGGGGSIGSELCRQIAKFKPSQLIILDMYENNAYDIQMELTQSYPKMDIKALIANIKDRTRLEEIFGKYRPEVLFHAAAYKHVPLMEAAPREAVKNNVFGTLNLMLCADKYKVKKVIQISTDKAVNPTNVMGTTKRICEMIAQGLNRESETEFVAVRFGNVLGSNGSVIPLFKKQIERGGPLTVTHRDITRYFMTIPEAAQLVLQAATYAKGGEIFVLDMGEPVRIYDLALNMLKLSDLEPGKDIEIKITGLRPGEKLYEELSKSEEDVRTVHEKIFVAKPLEIDFAHLKGKLDTLYLSLDGMSDYDLRNYLKDIVPEYEFKEKISKQGALA
ncbi:nucleoside-diphosphate sugar epimerase/dehydratase [Acetivibrio sp. MSJd-27]|uniref:polysaccharide biosynthesis protein n=1 Tax=Acetivibrio sp. MSJd-27 TaxID=2841523 RepID=UPI0020A233E9|nr:nucleoside-diphosphate sugar epimerase/dehydratase [Acetivibrio sp. MSJd-27]